MTGEDELCSAEGGGRGSPTSMNGQGRERSRILVASGNPGKIREFAALLQEHFREVLSLTDLKLTGPEEDRPSYRGNAVKKARTACEASGHVTLADDSGLEVEVLGGAPGVQSQRYAPDPASRIRKLWRQMSRGGHRESPARFVCVLALAHPRLGIKTFRGIVRGRIIREERGTHGFGYDPVFYLHHYHKTMAELDPAVKNRISHRARALGRCATWLLEHPEWTRV